MTKELTATSLCLKQWHEGKQEGLDALLERHIPWLQGQVRKRLSPELRGKADTHDYVQDAVVKFLRYAPRFTISDEAPFRALLLKVVESTLLNRYRWFTARRRQMARERPLPADTVLTLDPPQQVSKTPSQSASRHEEEAWIRLSMEFLDPDDREVIVLREWDGLSYPEIAARVDITADAARMRHNRAMGRLSDKVYALRCGIIEKVLETDE